MEVLDNFLEVLANQDKLYNELLELATLKLPVLVNGEVEQLDQIVKKEQQIIIQVGKLEGKRNSIHQALANHFCVQAEELNAQKLISLVSSEYKVKIEEIISNLRKTTTELEKLNSQNTALIKQSLDFINFSLNLLTGFDSNPTYDKNQINNGAIAKIFDQKI